MNGIDLIALVLVVFALILGIRSGALPQLFGLGGALVGVLAAIEILVLFRASLLTLDSVQRSLLSLGVVFVGMAIGETIGSAVGAVARRQLGTGILEALDRVAGGALGAAQALFMVWLLGGLLAASSVPSLNIQAEQSVTLRSLAGVLPPPGAISADLHGFLDASGIPDVFVGLEPAPAPAVPTPGQSRADSIASSAVASTVEVEAEACGYTLSGTGFSIAPGYVVTNAHVIAGERAVVVRTQTATYDAQPVLFDPELDVAVLYSPGFDAPALHFAATIPARGSIGAALGHPGGGPLTVVPAAVTRSYLAQGRDLYGTRLVSRQIVELDAAIQRGDSGGPLILTDGTVGGVVFAASRTSSDVGYALAPTEVSAEVMPAVGRTSAVSPGACIS